jgi:Protein of unknown function (DUF2971)
MADELEPPVPEILWKYRQWDEKGHAKVMIELGEVYYARKSELNDPMDLIWREDRPKSVAERRKYAKEMSRLYYPHLTRAERKMQVEGWVQQFIEESGTIVDGSVETSVEVTQGLLSCSEVNDDFQMWSHYSGGHRGICVGLRTDKIQVRFWRCIYQDEPALLDYWAYVTWNLDGVRTVSRTKSNRWSYEREWRSISIPGPFRHTGCVDSVVFGLNTDAETRENVGESIERSGQPIKLLQIRKVRSHYKLEAVPI